MFMKKDMRGKGIGIMNKGAAHIKHVMKKVFLVLVISLVVMGSVASAWTDWGLIDWTAPVPDDHIQALDFEVTTWPTFEELTQKFEVVHQYKEGYYNGDGSWGCGYCGGEGGGNKPLIRVTGLNVLGYISAYRATGIAIYKQRAQEGLDYLVQEQQPNGQWVWWYTLEGITTPNGESLYVSGIPTAALCEGYKLFNNESYKNAAKKGADYLSSVLIHENANYDLFAAWGLGQYYEITGEQWYLNRAKEFALYAIFEQGTAPGDGPHAGILLPSGYWSDGHNGGEIWYKGICTRCLIVLLSVMPTSDPDYTKIEEAAYKTLNHLRLTQRADGKLLLSPSYDYPWHASESYWYWDGHCGHAFGMAKVRLNWPVMDSIRAMANSAPNSDPLPHGRVLLTLGTFLEAYSSGPDTTPPSITAHLPTGTSVPVDTTISVTFSEMMNQTSVENAFSVSPSVSGSLGWDGNKMVFTPSSNLAYETTYTVTINTSAEDLADPPNNLQSPYSWDFTTALSGGCYTYKLVNPGESIQDAINGLCPEGGTIELAAAGVHDVYNTIVIDRSNVTIQGTHDSEIRSHDSNKDVFVIPHENPTRAEDWPNLPKLENLVFKGFLVTSTDTTRGSRIIVHAWNVNNLTVEDTEDLSYGYAHIAINPATGGTTARSQDIFIKDNIVEHGGIVFCYCTNAHVINNTFKDNPASFGLESDRNNHYVYLIGNYVENCGVNGGLTVDAGSNYEVRDNIVIGSQKGIYIEASQIDSVISNNTITGTTMAGIFLKPQFGIKNITIKNNRIYNNSGHAIWTTEFPNMVTYDSLADITNNVIYNNGGDGISMGTQYMGLEIFNNIITNNSGHGIKYTDTVNPSTIKYNDVWNNTNGNYNGISAGTGDISVDPRFIDPENGDFHLRSTAGRWIGSRWVIDSEHSPCIDAGDPSSDYSNEPSPNGGRINMGAYGDTAEASKSGGVYYVSLSGNDANNGTTLEDAWRHISYAVTQVQAGDTVLVVDGTYEDEHVVFTSSCTPNNPLTLKAYNGTPILDGINKTGIGIRAVSKSYLTISGFHIRNYLNGISIEDTTTNVTLKDFTIENTQRTGLLFKGSGSSVASNISISNFTMYETGLDGYPAIFHSYGWNSSHGIDIFDFEIRNTYGEAINWGFSERVHIHDGKIHDTASDAIHFDKRIHNSTIENMWINNSGFHGICIHDWTEQDYPSYNNTIKNCYVANSVHNNIDLHGGAFNTVIEGCAIDGTPANGQGIYFHHVGDGLLAENNSISNMQRAFWCDSDNYIRNAVFKNNTIINSTRWSGGSGSEGELSNISFIGNTFVNCGSDPSYSNLAVLTATGVSLKGNKFEDPIHPDTPQIYLSSCSGEVVVKDLADKTTKIQAQNTAAEVRFKDGRAFNENGGSIPHWYPNKSNYLLTNEIVTFTIHNMTAVPASGSATVNIEKFDTSLPQGEILVDFTADTTDGNNVVFTVGNLEPSYYYTVKKDSNVFSAEQANSLGYIQFSNSEWSACTFTIEETSGVDKTPPTTNTIKSPTPNEAGWNNVTVVVTFFRSDNDSSVTYTNLSASKEIAVEVEGFNYTIPKKGGGNLTIPLNATFSDLFNVTVSDEGITTMWYNSVDNNSNIETIKNVTVKIDISPPKITNAQATSVTTNSATITWDTNEEADTKVTYDTNPSNLGTFWKNNSELTKSHSILLSGLNNNTTYFFMVYSTDAAGNTANSTIYNFTTSPVLPGNATVIMQAPDEVNDNRLREATPNTMLGSTTFIDVGRIGSIGNYRDVIWVNLSQLNSTDQIKSAKLSLFWYYVGRNKSTTVEIYRPWEWDENYVNWNNRMNGFTWNNLGGDWYDRNNVAQGNTPYASLIFPIGAPDNAYHDFDVTELVQSYISGTYDNAGFFIKANEVSDSYIAFRSSDWGNASERPKLVVSYSWDASSEDTTPPASISDLHNTTSTIWINWTWTNPTDTDFNHTMVYLNSTWQTNTSSTYYNATGLNPDTSYEIGTHTVDTYGNVNATWMNQTTKTLAVSNPSPCFIATAAYGTPLHEDINVLRDFRDEYLMTNPLGRAFVEIYYATSPPIADVIRENEGLRTAVREGLVKPLVYVTRAFVG